MPRKKVNSTDIKSVQEQINNSSNLVAQPQESSQLSVFDYSGYSEDFKLKSYERKARIKANEQVATKAFYDIAQDVKAQHDDLGNYQEWLKWCDKELDYKENMACSFLKIGTEITAEFRSKSLPTSHSALDRLARALSKVDEETKEEILEKVETAKPKNGKALTENEIKEITKPYLQQIEQLKAEQEKAKQEQEQLVLALENANTRTENVKAHLNSEIETKEKELAKAKETLANQNKQIQELNTAISAKENQLLAIANKQAELDNELIALEKSKANLDGIVNQTVQDKLAEEKIKALADIERQKAELQNQEKELKSEIKKQQSILNALDKQKKQFINGSDWLRHIKDFNLMFTERALGINVISRIDELSSLPDINSFGEEEKAIFEREFLAMLNTFNKNKEAWTNAVNQIDLILNRMSLELNVLTSKAVEVEVVD